jgi:hypothetical protein
MHAKPSAATTSLFDSMYKNSLNSAAINASGVPGILRRALP